MESALEMAEFGIFFSTLRNANESQLFCQIIVNILDLRHDRKLKSLDLCGQDKMPDERISFQAKDILDVNWFSNYQTLTTATGESCDTAECHLHACRSNQIAAATVAPKTISPAERQCQGSLTALSPILFGFKTTESFQSKALRTMANYAVICNSSIHFTVSISGLRFTTSTNLSARCSVRKRWTARIGRLGLWETI